MIRKFIYLTFIFNSGLILDPLDHRKKPWLVWQTRHWPPVHFSPPYYYYNFKYLHTYIWKVPVLFSFLFHTPLFCHIFVPTQIHVIRKNVNNKIKTGAFKPFNIKFVTPFRVLLLECVWSLTYLCTQVSTLFSVYDGNFDWICYAE